MRQEFILVADRSDGLVENLKSALAATNYLLLHAKNGEEADYLLELLKSEITLAIIELDLPLLSGLDLIWRLVKRKQPKPLKIIATTSTAVLKRAIVGKRGERTWCRCGGAETDTAARVAQNSRGSPGRGHSLT